MKKIFTCISIMMMLIGMQVSAQEPTMQLGPTDSFGFLNGPDGEMWTYTADFTTKYGFYTFVDLKVYDSKKQLVGQIADSLVIADENVTGVRDLQVTSFVTKKFFNFDNNYELMLFITANTKQYVNKYFNRVYSIYSDSVSTQPVCEMPGNMVISKNLGEYNENYTVIFRRDSANTASGMQYFDTYTKASYASPDRPELKHTFAIPYSNIAALNDLFPVFMVKNGAYINYVTTQYEKPYFVPGTPLDQDPVVSENNHLVITYLNQKFDTVHTTKIPVVQDANEKLLYTFPLLGGLGFDGDIIMNYNGGNTPAYVVTMEKYDLDSDGSVKSYYLYDVAGQKVGTIAENVLSSVHMNPIAGQEDQWMFIKEEYDGEFLFVNVPSCTVESEISIYLEDGKAVSQNIDRYPVGDSYQYVVALLQGDNEQDGTVSQKLAWLNKDGSFNHYEKINLGPRIEAANVYVSADALNPMVFNTDAAREYMVLVKRYAEKNTNDKETALLVCSTNGDILLDYGKDASKGGDINTVFLLNAQNEPQLLTIYTNAKGQYTLNFTQLPLAEKPLKGSGTAEDPYQITSMTDFMKIENAPDAHYLVVNDVDFMSVPFAGLKTAFTGVLDGDNYQFKNVNLDGSGLFAFVNDNATIKDLVISHPVMQLGEVSTPAGIVVNTIQGNMSGDDGSMEVENVTATLQNIQIISPKVVGEAYKGMFGGIAGNASLFVSITQCWVKDAAITLPLAEGVGGLAGQLATSSYVKACAFDGVIEAGKVVGGAVATAGSGEQISHIHVNAAITGSEQIGGVIGHSERAPMSNCYVEGSLTAKSNAIVAKMGGMIGELTVNETGDGPIVIENCLVGVEEIGLPAALDSFYVHRVIGFSGSDKYNYFEGKYEAPETKIKGCYVVSDLAPIDATIQLTDTTTEGATLAWENVTAEWLGEHGFKLGDKVDTPWEKGENLILWYENDQTTDLENIWGDCSDMVSGKPAAKKLIIDGQLLILRHDGVYSVTGARVK